MFKIESYVTPILLSYVDKYVKDFKPADAQLSLWGGGVALHNLVLKPDVLEQEVSIPFTLISGRIHELLIQVPWTKIMSEPITVSIDTIECVLGYRPPAPVETTATGTSSPAAPAVEAPPGYMQALVWRIVSNITVKVHHLIVKYVQDDIVLSLNVKHLSVESASPKWETAFADIDQNKPVLRRIVKLDDLTLCLDQSDADGMIRFYQEPLLYRCQLTLRVMTKLISSTIRRASSISMQLRSERLAFGLTSEQLTLVLRLVSEHRRIVTEVQQPKAATNQTNIGQTTAEASTEPVKTSSWTEWAWSWLPTIGDREGPADEVLLPKTSTDVFAGAYLDEICLTFKTLEVDGGGRKRPRSVLELCFNHLAFKSYMLQPTQIRAKLGIRNLLLKSNGKCVCGHLNQEALDGEPTYFVIRKPSDDYDENWKWPRDDLEDDKLEPEQDEADVNNSFDATARMSVPTGKTIIDGGDLAKESSVEVTKDHDLSKLKVHSETAKEELLKIHPPKEEQLKIEQAKDDLLQITPTKEEALKVKPTESNPTEDQNVEEMESKNESFEDKTGQVQFSTDEENAQKKQSDEDRVKVPFDLSGGQSMSLLKFRPQSASLRHSFSSADHLNLWEHMDPIILVDFTHNRTPPIHLMNPFDNPPKSFEYSDWEESCTVKVVLEPIDIRVSAGLFHRLAVVSDIFKSVPIETPEIPMRVLTVEESDALFDNLPQRTIDVEISELRIRLVPWDHCLAEKPMPNPVLLDIVLATAHVAIIGPLYPNRVCAAACQMPTDAGPLWTGSHLHVTVALKHILVQLSGSKAQAPKPCVRTDLRLVLHILLNPAMFAIRHSVVFKYTAKIHELAVSGSNPRLTVARHIVLSLLAQKLSLHLRHTSMPLDALRDENLAILDLTLEDITCRGFLTEMINTHIVAVQAIRGLVIQQFNDVYNQAWIISGPDSTSSTAHLRCAVQWCAQPLANSLDYIGFWMEPLAFSLDPLLLSWLSYKPTMKLYSELTPPPKSTSFIPSSVYFRRRTPSSSGRGVGGSRGNSAQEPVHMKSHSVDSSSGRNSEKKTTDVSTTTDQKKAEVSLSINSSTTLLLNHQPTVHEPGNMKSRSVDSSSGRNSKNKTTDASTTADQKKAEPTQSWWKGDNLLQLHGRLKHMLISVETGVIMLYMPSAIVSALECPTIYSAMEQHAREGHQVMVTCFGRLNIHTSAAMKYMWQEVKSEGPTYIDHTNTDLESFPWKLKLADISCYVLEPSLSESDPLAKHKKKSTLKKAQLTVHPVSIVELFTTTLTFSVLTKSVQYVILSPTKTEKKPEPTKGDAVLRYFSTGVDFKPTSVMDFIRGPQKRKKEAATETTTEKSPTDPVNKPVAREQVVAGPMVSLGFHLHADTPPILIKLDSEQMQVVLTGLHCLQHFMEALRPSPLNVPRYGAAATSYIDVKSYRTTSPLDQEMTTQLELDSASSDASKDNDLIPIFEPPVEATLGPMKTFIWFQWVIANVKATLSTDTVKLVFELDGIMATIDLQEYYNQLRIKIENFSLQNQHKNDHGEWVGGAFGGRIIEVREPANAQEDSQFLSITITQASLSNLPPSWKEELHPKLLDPKINPDLMWEFYSNMASLDIILQPTVVKRIAELAARLGSNWSCPPRPPQRKKPWTIWPFIYINSGGFRIVSTTEEASSNYDDCLIINIDRITTNPHPDNPIGRKLINSNPDSAWGSNNTDLEGRQYETTIRSVTVKTGLLQNIVDDEAIQLLRRKNPARKWSSHDASFYTAMLHSVSLGCVAAPPLYDAGIITCGAAIEVNLVSDCSIEFTIDQLFLIRTILADFTRNAEEGLKETQYFMTNVYNIIKDTQLCPYTDIVTAELTTVREDSTYNSPVVSTNQTRFPSPHMSQISYTTLVDYTANMNQKVVVTPVPTKHDLSGPEGLSLVSEKLEILTQDTKIEPSQLGDSGTETASFVSAPASTQASVVKKKSSLFALPISAWDNFEVYVTVGVIEVSFYAKATSKVAEPSEETEQKPSEDVQTDQTDEQFANFAMRGPEKKQLLTVTFYQPNLYFWKKKSTKQYQFSLFNLWVALGSGFSEGSWQGDRRQSALLTTAKGVPDPLTDVPPALLTLKHVFTYGQFAPSARGVTSIDVERPIMFEICANRFRLIKDILDYMKAKRLEYGVSAKTESSSPPVPAPYKLRVLLQQLGVDVANINVSQVGLQGSLATLGWDSAQLQVAWSPRPERLLIRGLVTAFLVSAGPPNDVRRPIVHPLHIGIEIQSVWPAWRRNESQDVVTDATTHLAIDFDCITVDLRPVDLDMLSQIRNTLHEFGKDDASSSDTSSTSANVSPETSEQMLDLVAIKEEQRLVGTVDIHDFNFSSAHSGNHFYKDDLRSGAFKIVSGNSMPMPYQVILRKSTVSWMYPHPRGIIRIVAFPIPGQSEEIPCVLEMFNQQVRQWTPHSYISVPMYEPKELNLFLPSPQIIFASTWRFRVIDSEEKKTSFAFNLDNYVPRDDPFNSPPIYECNCPFRAVFAEQLCGALRVDSYFSQRLNPQTRLTLRLVSLEAHLHNSLPNFSSAGTKREGYYVSKPLMRAHRVLTVATRNVTMYSFLGSPAGILCLATADLASDVMNSSSGIMVNLVNQFHAQMALSVPARYLGAHMAAEAQMRFCATTVHVRLNVPRLRTLQSLGADWKDSVEKFSEPSNPTGPADPSGPQAVVPTRTQSVMAVKQALDGRVSLWVNNSCTFALRIGQEGTDEVLPLGPGVKLAYRWRSPKAVKRLRFAVANPAQEWQWSTSVPFREGKCRVRLECTDANSPHVSGGWFLYVKVENKGAARHMRLSGKLLLANMLRFNLLYKVRASSQDLAHWKTVSTGDLAAETLGRSVLCASNNELVLKIRLADQETGWSGDIPLKECPKENVPWLVKVPSNGDMAFISVWCRVVRAKSDGRLVVSIWPLYVLRSNLPLDTDVLISTEMGSSQSQQAGEEEPRPTPLVQSAPGRGFTTHLMATGTTAARHLLSFQYRDIDCPVTREAVPLHYGLTDTSVFEKAAPVNTIEEVTQSIFEWKWRSSRDAASKWPYSVVRKHWEGQWQPALLQPRSEIAIRYKPVRISGGGCSLEVQLSPMLLMCNASPVTLTLRAHDAAPLCKLEPGIAISPPSTILKKSFFMSIEAGRETFVSRQLKICSEEPGRYGSPAPGYLALEHPILFAVQCNQKISLLTMHYEIHEDINIIGITSTYLLINRLKVDLMAAAMAVPNEGRRQGAAGFLHPPSFKVVPPTDRRTLHGVPMSRLWLYDRWHGDDASLLQMYLCLQLTSDQLVCGDEEQSSTSSVPIHLGYTPVRRAVALTCADGTSMPVVVTQQKHEGRWIVTVSKDPCPEYIVWNATSADIAVGQPLRAVDEASSSATTAVTECEGVTWSCVVQQGAKKHYSTPAHCSRLPPADDLVSEDVPYLTFSLVYSDQTVSGWCPPVPITEGEQLVPLFKGVTIKLRACLHPHSSLIELLDVEKFDIAASDIRRRLVDTNEFTAFDSVPSFLTAEPKLLPPPESVDHYFEKSQKDDKVDFLMSNEARSSITIVHPRDLPSDHDSTVIVNSSEMITEHLVETERVRALVEGVVLELASTADVRPLLAVHLDRVVTLLTSHAKFVKTTLSVGDIQVDNLQYDTGQFDFAVIATTRDQRLTPEQWPPVLNMFNERKAFATKYDSARFLVKVCNDKWRVVSYYYSEITELDLQVGPLALYVEDSYVKALVELLKLAAPGGRSGRKAVVMAEANALRRPLRLRSLIIRPVDLTLTLHTAVRMYIALDHSPLHLSAFKLRNMVTNTERLVHALTVHYLSAAILGAGWVVGGLELLGAPGALAARVGGATGGVRGIASAAAAGLLRSLSAWAGSLARNLDLLAGDEEHARRAAAARRRPPDSLVAGLAAGITNFAINILGAVGGLAHHPLVGVAIGESGSGAMALRRGLLGALTKPLSATADLVAYAGHGLLQQTGWDPVPQPRQTWCPEEVREASWDRDCVRWTFRLGDIMPDDGFEVLLDGVPLQLLINNRYIIVADAESEKIAEMIDLRQCQLLPYRGPVIELLVKQKRAARVSLSDLRKDDDDEYQQVSAAAMARVARYTGADLSALPSTTDLHRSLQLLALPEQSRALYCALVAAVHANADTHFALP